MPRSFSHTVYFKARLWSENTSDLSVELWHHGPAVSTAVRPSCPLSLVRSDKSGWRPPRGTRGSINLPGQDNSRIPKIQHMFYLRASTRCLCSKSLMHSGVQWCTGINTYIQPYDRGDNSWGGSLVFLLTFSSKFQKWNKQCVNNWCWK